MKQIYNFPANQLCQMRKELWLGTASLSAFNTKFAKYDIIHACSANALQIVVK